MQKIYLLLNELKLNTLPRRAENDLSTSFRLRFISIIGEVISGDQIIFKPLRVILHT
jgi:hypothetical protein